MQTNDCSAKAFERLSVLSAQREAWHRARFAAVKQRRAIAEYRREIGLVDRLTGVMELHLNAIDDMCKAEREYAWARIVELDAEIDTLTHQLNEGVFNDVKA